MYLNLFIALFLIFTHLLSIQANVTVEKIVKDLKNQKRYIFAVGYVTNKYLLFVSGSKDKIDFSNGYQVEFKEEPIGGKIKKLENVASLSKYSGIEDADIMFVYNDPSGNFLVTMKETSVKALDLGSGVYKDTNILDPIITGLCHYEGNRHLSFKDNPFFYTLGNNWDESGNLLKFNFDNNKSVVSSSLCQQDMLGNLCITDDNQITSGHTCKGPPPPHISGIVDRSTVYLFTKSNEIYYFSKEALEGKTVPLSKVGRKTVWKDSVHTTTKLTSPHTSSTKSILDSAIIVVIIVPLLVILLSVIGIIMFYFFCGKKGDKQKVLTKQKGKSIKNKKSDKLKSKTKSKTKGKSKSHAESKHSSKFSTKEGKSTAGGEKKTSKHDSPTSRLNSNKSADN